MTKDLSKLLHKGNNFELTSSFMDDVIEIMKKEEKNLGEFITSINIDYNFPISGCYSPYKRLIIINPNIISECAKGYCKEFFIKTLRHEIEHAKCLKKLYQNSSDLETCLLKAANLDYIKEMNLGIELVPDELSPERISFYSDKLYVQNHNLNPEERIVEVRALLYLLELVNNTNDIDAITTVATNLFLTYQRGYEASNEGYMMESPTYKYLLNMKMFYEQELIKKKFEDLNYSLEEKLLYGLPISFYEYGIRIGELTKIRERSRKSMLPHRFS